MNDQDIEDYNKIQKDMLRMCRSAEKKCSKFHQHAYWSPTVKNAILETRYWKIKEDALKNNRDCNEQLEYIRSITSIEDETKTIEDVMEKTQSAMKVQKGALDNAQQLRTEYLTNLAETYANQNDISVSKAVRELMLHEEEREIFRIIKSKMNDYKKSQLDAIWIPKDKRSGKNTNDKVIVDAAEDINNKLLKRNRRHLNQAYKTPIANNRIIDWTKNSEETVNKILEGTWTTTADI